VPGADPFAQPESDTQRRNLHVPGSCLCRLAPGLWFLRLLSGATHGAKLLSPLHERNARSNGACFRELVARRASAFPFVCGDAAWGAGCKPEGEEEGLPGNVCSLTRPCLCVSWRPCSSQPLFFASSSQRCAPPFAECASTCSNRMCTCACGRVTVFTCARVSKSIFVFIACVLACVSVPARECVVWFVFSVVLCSMCSRGVKPHLVTFSVASQFLCHGE
jgi:hypothetical protein